MTDDEARRKQAEKMANKYELRDTPKFKSLTATIEAVLKERDDENEQLRKQRDFWQDAAELLRRERDIARERAGHAERDCQRIAADRDRLAQALAGVQYRVNLPVSWEERGKTVHAWLAADLESAAEPFVRFAKNNVEPDPEAHPPRSGMWKDGACQRERIVDWFGPSDFQGLVNAPTADLPSVEEGCPTHNDFSSRVGPHGSGCECERAKESET